MQEAMQYKEDYHRRKWKKS